MAFVNPQSLEEALDRFDDWSKRAVEAREWRGSQPLYHYTSLETLPKILASEQIRMTSIFAQSKDQEEFRFGAGLLREVVSANMAEANRSPLHTSFFKGLEDLDVERLRETFDCHIACFAPHGEDFDLWEHFGDRGHGVAIRIGADFFQVRDHGADEPLWGVQPVIYGREVTYHSFRKAIQVASMALGEACEHIGPTTDTSSLVSHLWYETVADHVIPICTLAKKGDFIPEMEVRIFAPSTLEGRPSTQFRHADLPHHFIEGILVGERADINEARAIVHQFGLSPDLVQVAAYSRGLENG